LDFDGSGLEEAESADPCAAVFDNLRIAMSPLLGGLTTI
jgi:hypothetical protein